MKTRTLLAVLSVAALAPFAWAGAAVAQTQASGSSRSRTQGSGQGQAAVAVQRAGAGSAAIASGTQISAELLTTLNAKKAKPGQRVVAKVTKDVKQDGHTVIHKGSRLVGHVVSVQQSSEASAGSQMNVAFDQLVQGGTTTALNAVVNSIVSAPSMTPTMGDMSPAMPAPMAGGGAMGSGGAMGGGGARGGGLVGGAVGSTVGAAGSAVGSVGPAVSGVGSTVGATAGAATQATNQVAVGPVRNVGGALGASTSSSAAASHSATLGSGPGNLGLGSSAGASNQTNANSVFSTPKGNLQLQSGTELQFQVVDNAQAHSPTPR